MLPAFKKTDMELPKTAEEMIEVLESNQKISKADDFFRKVFNQDPVDNENKFLHETVANLQTRVQELEAMLEAAIQRSRILTAETALQ